MLISKSVLCFIFQFFLIDLRACLSWGPALRSSKIEFIACKTSV